MKYGLRELIDLDQGATADFPVGWYVVTKVWAKKYPDLLAAFLDALRASRLLTPTGRR
jgi:ABC-type nitrate/sulfonate/bicarbonate transport system substrate-binding protein